MKRILCSLAVTAIIGICSSAIAADTAFTQTDGAGEQVVLAITDTSGPITGAPDFTFNPSTNVVMGGMSSPTSFAAWSYHQNVDGKSSGQEYGMTSEVNKLFFLDISTDGTVETDSDATDSTLFAGWTKL